MKTHLGSHYSQALQWVRKNTIPEQGIIVHSLQRVPYLEVTGYLIPTLLEAGELALAGQYADFLRYMQRPNGSFAGPDGSEYIFDSGQALRGLLAAARRWEKFKPFARKTAEYLVSCMRPDGRLPASYNKVIPEAVHVFVLPALKEAAVVLQESRYLEAAQCAVKFYKHAPDVLNKEYLTHFLSYIIDGFIDMEEADYVRPLVDEIFSSQKRNGMIPAYSRGFWVCSTGLAQLAIIAYKLGLNEQADRALEHVCSLQNESGGFFGSYGLGADYFKNEEISWANKFFLDAVHLKEKGCQDSLRTAGDKPALLDDEEWHEALADGPSVEGLAAKIRSNDFPLWCRPLLENTTPEDVILELGSGTGELSAICALYQRRMMLLDYSQKSLDFARQLFESLNLKAEYIHHDILKELCLAPQSVDWVYSSGVLEHFTREQMVQILQSSGRVVRKGVMCLVPNANALFYRIGKNAMEQDGTWKYGHEVPQTTMRPLFEEAGLKNIREYSIAAYHTTQFWGQEYEDIKNFFDSLTPEELRGLNQGYLIFTIGTVA